MKLIIRTDHIRLNDFTLHDCLGHAGLAGAEVPKSLNHFEVIVPNDVDKEQFGYMVYSLLSHQYTIEMSIWAS